MSFFDIIPQQFKAMHEASDDALERLVPSASDTAIHNACERIHALLIRNATIAVNRIEEVGGYQPLREHFLNNVRNSDHIKVVGDTIRVWDEVIGGTHSDLKAGMAVKRGTGSKVDRLIRWMYCIYMPAREWEDIEEGTKALEKYQETIARRLAVWGDKAPYWYFINYGNEGMGAYPHFKGELFIEKTIPFVARALREEKRKVGDAVKRGITVQIDTSYREKRAALERLPPLYPDEVPSHYKPVYTTKNGKVMWYNMITKKIAKWTPGIPGE